MIDQNSQITSKPSSKSKSKSGSLRYEAYISSSAVVIVNNSDKELLLHIDRAHLTSTFKPLSFLSSFQYKKSIPIYGLFGRVDMQTVSMLMIISKANVVATVGQSEIYKIETVKFFVLNFHEPEQICFERISE